MTVTPIPDFAWEHHPDLQMPRANFMGCAYNAAVNHGSGRAGKKMGGLIDAINWYERACGFVKLTLLVEAGVIESFTPCPQECHMRPGGLFHARDPLCENDFNHPVYRERQQHAREVLPGGRDGNLGWRAASVNLVGSSANDSGDWRRASQAMP